MVHDPDEHDAGRAVTLPHAHERGRLLLAGDAPRREEVDDHDLAAQVRETDASGRVEALEVKCGRGLVDRAGAYVLRIAPEPEREHEDEPDDPHDRDGAHDLHGARGRYERGLHRRRW